jgi:7-alpha-hydroxysteroid dehydrogenase
VTGGGAGIGRGIAEFFAQAGAAVVVSDLKEETAAAVAEGIKAKGGQAIAVACDVTNDQALENLVKKTLDAFGKITILINNAGGGGPKPFDMPWTALFGPTSSMYFRCSISASFVPLIWKRRGEALF